MPLDAIPVHLAAPDASLSGNALPVLLEIASQLQNLLETPTSETFVHTIDLGALPLTAADKTWLKTQLGHGEIAANLEANGRSSIDETGCPGVWWVTHRDVQDQVQSEFIEVCRVPELLKAHPDDIESGHERLKNRISDLR